MPQWLRPATRWAIYVRDDMRCIYCRVSIQELIRKAGNNFLTVDHVRSRQRGGTSDHVNLITCCYDCNISKKDTTLAAWCRSRGWSASAVSKRIGRRRARNLELYRSAAHILLGKLEGVPVATLVEHHDWLVKRQWGDSLDGDHWTHLQEQAELFCSACGAATAEAPASQIPF